MKTLLIFSLIFFVSCSIELTEPQLSLRSDYITYNPQVGCVGQEVTVTFDNGYGNNCGTSRIQQHINGAWITVIEEVPQNGIITHAFVPGAPGNYRFRASWNKSGKFCNQENIKPFEEDPLQVERDCCQDYFTATSICDEARECPYGLEFHFMTTMDNWISITGHLPEGYSFCGFYDEYGNIIENYSGNTIELIWDVYACIDLKFFVYFTAPTEHPSFGTWTVMDMHGVLYESEPQPCE
jgi:hypothetical protein